MAKTKLEDLLINGVSFNVAVNAEKTEDEFIEFHTENGTFGKDKSKQAAALTEAYAKIKAQDADNKAS